MMNKPNLSHYMNYRAYLRDWCAWLMEVDSSQSWRSIAQLVGMDFAAWYRVCKEERRLSQKSLPHVLDKLEIFDRERAEFELLYKIDKAKTEVEESELRHQLIQLRSAGFVEDPQPENALLTSWLNPVIFSILQIHPIKGSRHKCMLALKSLIKFPVGLSQIDASLNLLEVMGKISLSEQGFWCATPENISAGLSWNDSRLRSYHKEWSEVAVKAIETFSKEERNFSAYTLQLSAEALDDLCKEIKIFQEKIKVITESSSGPQGVVQVNLQLFPMTHLLGGDQDD